MTKQMIFAFQPPQAAYISRLIEAAEAGDGDAACRLGDLYHEGKWVPQRPRKAFRWYARGAMAGDPYAMNNLGACYHNGCGCRVDLAMAAHWYERGVQAGSVEALDNLGRCYVHGVGVDQDLQRAAALFREAHAKGHPQAADRLAQLGLSIDVPDDIGYGTTTTDASVEETGKSSGLGRQCPRCGSHDLHPADFDSWWCGGCSQEFPTSTQRCRHPGCLEWAWDGYCEQHEDPSAGPDG